MSNSDPRQLPSDVNDTRGAVSSAQLLGKFDDYVIDFAVEKIALGERVSLVTLVGIDGASPRPLGAQMVVSETGAWAGYLSGGCIERAVVAEALEAITAGENRRVRYGRGSKYIDIQLPCGSAIELFFQVNVSLEEVRSVNERLQIRQSAVMAIPCEVDDHLLTRVYTPQRRLVVVGSGPAAVKLASIASLSGFLTELYSPDRSTLAAVEASNIASFPLAIGCIPDFRADTRTAFAFMFHDHEWERSLVPVALKSSAFYIGAMGSHRTHRQRIEMLAEAGFDLPDLQRIRGPIGLIQASKSASDIAISIIAEIIQAEASDRQSLIGGGTRFA